MAETIGLVQQLHWSVASGVLFASIGPDPSYTTLLIVIFQATDPPPVRHSRRDIMRLLKAAKLGGYRVKAVHPDGGSIISELIVPARAAGLVAVTTQHYDNARTGWNPGEAVLTPNTVRERFSLRFSQHVDGQIYAQPLYVRGLELPGYGPRNVVFVATEAGSVYAFDADIPDPVSPGNLGPYWSQSLVPAGERPFNVVGDLDAGCTDLVPAVCITSTPVIDLDSETLFVTAKTISVTGGVSHYRLHAIGLDDGSPRQQSVEITGSVPGTGVGSLGGQITFDPKHHHNRPGLLLCEGILYVAFASHCDVGPYHGWIFGFDARTFTRLSVFNTTPDVTRRPPGPGGHRDAGAIWQSGIGVAADAQNFLYCATGNGPFDLDLGGRDCGDSVLKLTPGLALTGFFTPYNQYKLNIGDQDLGSGGVMVLPDQPGPHPHLMVTCGKEGTVYLMDRTNPGGFDPSGDRVPPLAAVLPNVIAGSPGGVWGGPAYYNGPNGQCIFYCSVGGPLMSLSLSDSTPRLAPLDSSTETFPYPPYPGTPVVTSNGSTARTGVVWITRVAGNTISLLAFDAEDLKRKLLEAPAGPYNGGPKFTVPTVIDGRAFVGTDGRMAVFSL